jgi:hypothetical protein
LEEGGQGILDFVIMGEWGEWAHPSIHPSIRLSRPFVSFQNFIKKTKEKEDSYQF